MTETQVSDQLARIERRQEALVQAIDGLTDVMKMNTAMVVDLMEWLKEPPSSDTANLLKRLVACAEMSLELIMAMPDAVVRAIHADSGPHRG